MTSDGCGMMTTFLNLSPLFSPTLSMSKKYFLVSKKVYSLFSFFSLIFAFALAFPFAFAFAFVFAFAFFVDFSKKGARWYSFNQEI